MNPIAANLLNKHHANSSCIPLPRRGNISHMMLLTLAIISLQGMFVLCIENACHTWKMVSTQCRPLLFWRVVALKWYTLVHSFYPCKHLCSSHELNKIVLLTIIILAEVDAPEPGPGNATCTQLIDNTPAATVISAWDNSK